MAGYRRILVTEPDHPYLPAPGGRPATCSATSTPSPTRWSTCIAAIAAGKQPTPSFADGLAVQRVLDAVERSAADESRWTAVVR